MDYWYEIVKSYQNLVIESGSGSDQYVYSESSAIIILMYSAFGEVYAYGISVDFKGAEEVKKLARSSALIYPSKTSKLLHKMKKDGLLIFDREEKVEGRIRKYYRINPRIIQSPIRNGTYFKSDGSAFEIPLDLIEKFLAWLENSNKEDAGSKEFVEALSASHQYDYITFLEFLNDRAKEWEKATDADLKTTPEPKLSQLIEEYKAIIFDRSRPPSDNSVAIEEKGGKGKRKRHTQSPEHDRIPNDNRQHTSELKEAIRHWIDNFYEPCQDYPAKSIDRGSSVITACESHHLFTDLAKHLPVLGSNICEGWDGYKMELAKLDELKESLFSSLRGGILKCFEGMNLRFIYDDENHLRDYECRLNPLSLYNVVMDLLLGQEGYDNHDRFLSWLQVNAPIIEKDDHVLWGETITYLMVPKKDRALLEAGVSRFMTFVEDIPSSEFSRIAVDIRAKVDSLKPERDRILSELKRTLSYSNFPGKCEYMN
ncbi:MAG: PadR family transcriptional regulator [Methanotrichaceae archaeon]|nr:PadR family transcriptional regulator [Methanotrichaceae archaeon]